MIPFGVGVRSIIKHVPCVLKNCLRQMSPNPNNGARVSSAAIVAAKTSAVTKPLDLEINRIVWIDMEMSGLNLEKDRIMEVACLVTDSDLNIIAEGPDLIIHQPEELLNNMSEWCRNQHGKSGLTEACLKSDLSEEQAEKTLMQFLYEHVTENASPLAGNSVYMDRLFLQKFMPEVNGYLHYRIIDVSTIKELCRRWNPDVYKLAPKKDYSHRAITDIKESIEELVYYKDKFFKLGLA